MNFTWDCIQWTLLETASSELYLRLHPVNFTWDCTQWTLLGTASSELYLKLAFLFLSAWKVYQTCIKNASKVHHKRIKSASKLHQKCIKSASKVHQTCTNSASKVHQKCIKSVPKMHQKCIKFWPGFHLLYGIGKIKMALRVVPWSQWDFFDVSFEASQGLTRISSKPSQKFLIHYHKYCQLSIIPMGKRFFWVDQGLQQAILNFLKFLVPGK